MTGQCNVETESGRTSALEASVANALWRGPAGDEEALLRVTPADRVATGTAVMAAAAKTEACAAPVARACACPVGGPRDPRARGIGALEDGGSASAGMRGATVLHIRKHERVGRALLFRYRAPLLLFRPAARTGYRPTDWRFRHGVRQPACPLLPLCPTPCPLSSQRPPCGLRLLLPLPSVPL